MPTKNRFENWSVNEALVKKKTSIITLTYQKEIKSVVVSQSFKNRENCFICPVAVFCLDEFFVKFAALRKKLEKKAT